MNKKEEEIKKYIVHPRRKLIIQEGLGLGDFVDLDGLNADFSFKKTYEMGEDGETHLELLERVRGTGAGRGSIPDDGWVEVDVENGTNLQTIFRKAKEKKKEGDFV